MLSSKLLIVLVFVFSFNAVADIAVVTNLKNDFALSKEQIHDLFLGVKEAFPNGSPAKPVDQHEGTLRNEFYKKIADKDESDMNAYWANLIFTGNGRPPKMMNGNDEIKKYIRENPEGIAYLDATAVDASMRTVFVLK